ncbi:anti-sigma factor [Paenibacillus contaminans]|uniref:Anti-sigma factor n=1 Tax=Paenibacillus contaminans TaxID=450362 RepID=A0A329MUA3_9BACL|nr:anti-sigma factor [Paenibacillus contaminans]RAV22918.1 hypothetical protein DQG23_01555 [Paenibacillus contaminans]
MSDDFKRKLKQYADGTLPDGEREEMEREIAKMEAYQAYLDEMMDGGDGGRKPEQPIEDEPREAKKERSIIRRGKWKARFVNTLTVLAVLLLVTVVSSVITGMYYGTGEPNRTAIYRDVVTSAVAVSHPNTSVHLNGQGNAFFTMDLKGKLHKRVGDDDVITGDYSVRFLLGLASSPQISRMDEGVDGKYTFVHPAFKQAAGDGKEASHADDGDWATLEKLPEGTVAEAFLSFGKLFETDELLGLFENKNLQPLWFAADTGPDSWRNDSGVVPDPVGFPYWPVWHESDRKVDYYKEEKSGWFGKVVMSGGSYPALNAYGDGELRNENFLNTLSLLRSYKSVAKRMVPFLDIDSSIGYIEQNGVKLYGAVVTGPVKELLKLREEPWITRLQVGEVRLWNWTDR